MAFLVNINSKTPFEGELPVHPFTFELDNFQKYAIFAISKHENVLVTAKTGSGKTLVGEYQIYASLARKKRVFYTTPIKSLSNQKFHDLKKIYGDRVGIITGDIKFNPTADILIMTTEILRNLLYKNNTSTEGMGTTSGLLLTRDLKTELDAVIFDEVHYINDPERGKVWEETLIMLPREINLVLLSATIDSPEFFAEWLGQIKQKPIHCISTEYRIIPLHHYVINGTSGTELLEIMDSKNIFHNNVYKSWNQAYHNHLKDRDDFKEKVKNRDDGQVISDNKVRLTSYQHSLNETIDLLNRKNLLPALFFVFSRAGCEKFAHNVQGSLIDSSDAAAVKHIISFHLHRHMEKLEHLTQYHTLHDLLCRGVAFHHSGMLPILKEIVEILFNKGFIKVLFATETFAVGINMPTKTVVFTSLRKFDDKYDDMRVLRTDEYLQMAGRAGRRGIDTVGTVIYLPMKAPESLENVRLMMTGKTCSIESKLKLNYETILKSLHNQNDSEDDYLLKTLKNSYSEFQRFNEEMVLQQEIETLKLKQNKLNIESHLEELAYRKSLEIKLKNTKDKNTQTLLNIWNNKHMGPRWVSLLKSYEEYIKLQKEIDVKTQVIESRLQEEKHNKSVMINFLLKHNFIETSETLKSLRLTEKGLLATEINQMNPLMISEAYIHNLLYINDISSSELAALTSCFEVFNSQNKDLADSLINESADIPTGVLGYAYRNLEIIKKDMHLEDEYLTHNWCNPILDWCEGQEVEAICANYGLFPGNLVKTVLSVINALDELIVIGTLRSDIPLLEKATEAKTLMQRNITVSDSLYLRL